MPASLFLTVKNNSDIWPYCDLECDLDCLDWFQNQSLCCLQWEYVIDPINTNRCMEGQTKKIIHFTSLKWALLVWSLQNEKSPQNLLYDSIYYIYYILQLYTKSLKITLIKINIFIINGILSQIYISHPASLCLSSTPFKAYILSQDYIKVIKWSNNSI